ncbi:kynureninase [Scopulibacillus cellulosilyticus]|uniref:Kynureninase n=1 Tax=Scopulibacillus cellulosilyticus TaxID=2665665 RepID=A0ABW2PRX2_9BACL
MTNGTVQVTNDYALQLDNLDEFKDYRNEFYLNPGSIYLDGNSLGLMNKHSENKVSEILNDWKTLGIDGWTQGTYPWFFISERLGEMMAPLVGAEAKEVIVTGSTTVNLHQLVATFYKPEGKRTKIIADELTFPSDIYALKSQLMLHGYDPEEHLIRVKSGDGRFIEEDDIIKEMTDEVALIVLPTVLYRSGQLFDIQRLTAEAHKRGILIGFDGCHSVGAIPHYFSQWDVDFGFWCTYKYLNGGPGSVAALYVNKKHFGRHPGLAGWYSSNKNKQFDMEHTLVPEETAGAFQIGTPHVLSLAPLISSLEMFAKVSIENIRKNSLSKTQYFMDLIKEELSNMGFTIGNPLEDERRGGHICLEHEEAIRICKALKENQITPDFRAPNIIRLAPIAFYTSYEDIFKTVQILKKIMLDKQYEKYENKRGVVS